MTENYRIEAIALHEVGVFDDVRIDFPPIASPERDAGKAEIHVFTGPNGCGKSTLLYALAEIFCPISPPLGLIERRFRNSMSHADFKFFGDAGYYGAKPFENNSGKQSNEFGEYDIQYNNHNSASFFGFNIASYHQRQDWLSLATYKQAPQNFQTSRPSLLPPKAHYAAFAYSGQRTLSKIKLGAIQEISSSPFESALSFDSTVRPQVLLQWIANNRAQSALAKADGDLESAKRYDLALARITQAIREICDLDIEFRLERQPLAVTLRVANDIVQFDTLPDGLKSIISWIGDLSVRLEMIPWVDQSRDIFAQNLILFLDEIDIHLHPRWQRKILPVVQKLFPNSQIFVSTHSPFVVGSVEDAWIYQLPEKGKQTERVIKPVPSGAGKSYRLILEEIFDIDKEFDVETEALFDLFYQHRQALLKSRRGESELLDAARELAAKGEETRAIVERELRQISRLTGRDIHLA